MAFFEPRPDEAGIFQYATDAERTFALQGGVLHVTEVELNHLMFKASVEEVIAELGNLGISMAEEGVVEVNIHKSEDPQDMQTVFLATSPNDPLTEVPGSRIL